MTSSAGRRGRDDRRGASPAIDVLASGAGTVSGFTITSTTTPLIDAAGPINLTGNSVVVPTVPTVTSIGSTSRPAWPVSWPSTTTSSPGEH